MRNRFFSATAGVILAWIGAVSLLAMGSLLFATVCFSGGTTTYVPPGSTPARQIGAAATLPPLGSGDDRAGASLPQPTATTAAATATPQPAGASATTAPAIPTAVPPSATPPPPPPPSPTPVPPPPAPPAPAPPPPPQQQAQAPAAANFNGSWRVTDVITEGTGSGGQPFSFDVQLVQSGSTLSGSGSGLVISGVVGGRTATLQYSQPALGYTGSFVWTMAADGSSASGTFTSSAGNAGTSILARR